MSPHFQTRHYIKNEMKIHEILGDSATTLLESYGHIIAHFDEIMAKDYGIIGGGQAFINLDGLQLVLEA